MAEYASERERVIKAPRELVWALVSDTNRWDRAAGLAPAKYEWAVVDGQRVRLAKARELGMALEWIEPPYQWVEGVSVDGERRFVKGPLSGGRFNAVLSDTEVAGQPATRVSCRASVDANFAIGMFQKFKFDAALTRYLAGIAAVLEGRANELDTAADEPAIVQARRMLLSSHDEAMGGPRTPVDALQLEARGSRLKAQPVRADLAARLLAHLRDRPDEEVSQIRPFELAKVWDEDRREVLRTFLYACEAGLVDLSWQINCPVCRVGARMASSLDGMGGTSHCGACEIDYDIDFAQHVEAVFPCNDAVRRVIPALYCASSPAFLPHVFAQVRTRPGSSDTRAMNVPSGGIHLRTLWTKKRLDVNLAHAPARLEIEIGDGGISFTATGSVGGGSTEVVVSNRTNEETALLFERSSWSADTVLGTVIASMPEFANLFATEAPAAGVELKVGHVALLFSDLTGSTALYEKVGDARAFAIVEDHFRICEAEIGKHGGAVVKTMGDAVMASFASLPEATQAALGMIRAHDQKYAAMGLGVKIGVHAGPCLMVRANERLDYFGTTVNVAARLQAQADASEVVLTEANVRSDLVAPIVVGLPERVFEARLKGIRADQRLIGVVATSKPAVDDVDRPPQGRDALATS